jgi:hypothetical protein
MTRKSFGLMTRKLLWAYLVGAIVTLICEILLLSDFCGRACDWNFADIAKLVGWAAIWPALWIALIMRM